MAKKNQDHKQQREQARQQRMDAVRQKTAEPPLRVPKLCRTGPLTELCRDFYRNTGVDLFIGVPANVRNGPQEDRITVPPGMEIQTLGMQLMQLYAVCLNAAMKNVYRMAEYAKSSLELLLDACSPQERQRWEEFLTFINVARQFFCHYPYLWPNAVPEQSAYELRHYLDLSTGNDKSYWWPEQVSSENDGWRQLQEAVAQTADELYAWLKDASLAHGGDPAGPGTWKHKISVLYRPVPVKVKMKKGLMANWRAPIDWKWQKLKYIRQNSHGCAEGGSSGEKKEGYDLDGLMLTLDRKIERREAGLPGEGEGFSFLQDEIYAWAARELAYKERSTANVPWSGSGWRPK